MEHAFYLFILGVHFIQAVIFKTNAQYTIQF